MRRVTILGFIAASSIGAVVLVANAQQQASQRADFWPRILATPVVKEWFSDIPWHQKLGTQGGNEIDEALILPVWRAARQGAAALQARTASRTGTACSSSAS